MLDNILIGFGMAGLSCTVVTAFIIIAARWLNRHAPRFLAGSAMGPLFLSIVGVVFWLLLALGVTVALWAGLFLRLDLFTGWEPALYFTTVTITTLGYGDIILPAEHRLLTGFLATNGLILFSMSTAFLIEFLRRVLDVR
ncbi:potassium channel family protein [Sphingomicrobium aestuariivivum]|uniref:potassium channel family protein n=1 Tax=Sphingomicrobium aestuariivivum TaxID=1582356 RepID=UPI001FD64992|nr:potassium channel family protein [Sphingomicrobium aestuariivivum]MCJ8191980.1 potassium channel family protein [Sphingomicrobium aestuariivivum]